MNIFKFVKTELNCRSFFVLSGRWDRKSKYISERFN